MNTIHTSFAIGGHMDEWFDTLWNVSLYLEISLNRMKMQASVFLKVLSYQFHKCCFCIMFSDLSWFNGDCWFAALDFKHSTHYSSHSWCMCISCPCLQRLHLHCHILVDEGDLECWCWAIRSLFHCYWWEARKNMCSVIECMVSF